MFPIYLLPTVIRFSVVNFDGLSLYKQTSSFSIMSKKGKKIDEARN